MKDKDKDKDKKPQEGEENGGQPGVDNQDKSQDKSQDGAPYNKDYDKELSELRKENAKWRRKLRELENQKEIEDRKVMEEQQKFKELYEKELQKREELEGAIAAEKQSSALKSIAEKAGFNDPDDVRLINMDGVEWDGSKFVGLDGKITELKNKKPYLFKKHENIEDGVVGNTPSPKAGMSNYDKLTPEQREAILRKNIIKF